MRYIRNVLLLLLLLLFQCCRYQECLLSARKIGIIKGALIGLSLGCLWFCNFSMVGLANWYGTSLVVSDTGTSAGNVIFVSTIKCTADCSVGFFSFFLCWLLFCLSNCPSPIWGRALTQGTKEGIDFFLEMLSFPYCSNFLWEFIPEARGSRCR